VAILRGGRLRNRGLISDRSKGFFCSPTHTYCNSNGRLYWCNSARGVIINNELLRICRSTYFLLPHFLAAMFSNKFRAHKDEFDLE
jgi:hypothetical protein